jgi:hypothetical protein
VLAFANLLTLSLLAMAVIAAGALLAGVVGETVFQRVIPDADPGAHARDLDDALDAHVRRGAFLTPVMVTSIGFEPVLGIGGLAIIVAGVACVLLVGPDLRRAPDATIDTLRRVSRLPLFAGVPPAALEATVSRLVPVEVTAGTVVIREGDAPDRFYIIESGTFLVDQLDRGRASRAGSARWARTRSSASWA